MAKVVSFNRDAPALKPKGPRSWDHLFTMQISGDYITFAGQRELRAWRLTASNGAIAYAMEFPDKNALRMWLLEVLEAHEDAASAYVEQAARGELVSVNYYMSEDDVRKLGFIEPGKPLTLPSLPI